jgi:hypothetical protein
MNNILKIIIFTFVFFAFISCKKAEKINSVKYNVVTDGEILIAHNINTLIDSVASFDLRFLVKDSKEPKLTIGLIDSISINGNTAKLEDNTIAFYRSSYKLNLVKKNNFDGNVLFITFSNFKIQGDQASIVVKKVFGISMMQARFYFKKEKGLWVFVKKQNFGAIG